MHTSLHGYLGGTLAERDPTQTPEWVDLAPTTWSEKTKKEDPDADNLPDLLSKTVLDHL